MDEVAKLELHPPTLDTKGSGGAAAAPPSDGSTKPVRTGPIPMSMPSILRNPGVSQSNHLSYLLDRRSGSSSYPPSSSRTKPRSAAKEQLGRRKQRRSENARLLSNPHAVRPTIKDYRLHSNEIKSTFHGASGSSKASVPVPANSGVGYSEPVHDAASAIQGHFGKSLRDAQRVLKRLEVGNISDDMIRTQRAGELERFIWLVDREIRTWAQEEIHIFTPGDRKVGRILMDAEFQFTRPPLEETTGEQTKAPTVGLDEVRTQGQLIEFQRTPNALVWLVHDPFLRLIVHCLARVSRCPSFSKDDATRPGLRFTWILNRNPHARRSRRGRRVSVSSSAMSTADVRPQMPAVGAGVLETPPTTDFDSQTESELDASDVDSLAESVQLVDLEREGEGGGVDTDEDEAEILRRVHRWAVDSHRQRQADLQLNPARKCKPRATRTDEDPDQTLTAAIAEDDEESDDSS